MNKKDNLKLRVISLCLAGVLCFQEVSYSAPPYEGFGVIGSPKPLEQISADPTRFEVPADFSTLREIHKGSNGKLIIHIQDAHSNLSGQQNLASTLDSIMSKYGVSLVLVEGGASENALNEIKKIVPKEACKRTAKRLLTQGQIAGEEYLNLTSNHPMKIMGVEDLSLYAQSLKSYAALADKREKILQYLGSITRALEKLKAKMYPKELLSYEKEKNRDKGVESDFSGLLNLAQARNIDLQDLLNVQRLNALKDREKRINFEAANLEQAALFSELSRSGAKIDPDQFFKKVYVFSHFWTPDPDLSLRFAPGPGGCFVG